MNKAAAMKLSKVLVSNMGNDHVVVHTIFGEQIDMLDVTDVTTISVIGSQHETIEFKDDIHIQTSIEELCSDDNVLPFKYIERVVVDHPTSYIVLYQKQDPLFDAIKKYLGYKMHESEIWVIVEMARDIVPKTE